MRKILIALFAFLVTSTAVFAAKIPTEVKDFISKDFPNTTFRFDGVVILPDATVYLPLFPAKDVKPEAIAIQSTMPEGKKLIDKPNVVILNNEFVFLKVLTDTNGKKTLYKMTNIPSEVRTGLLPQDMLVPRGLVIPDNLKGIIGNLDITSAEEQGIKVESIHSKNAAGAKNFVQISQLKDKTIYVASPYNRNIQVINQSSMPEYALAQKNVPISMKGFDGFLLVTSYEKNSMDVISLADDQVIKQISFKTQPDEIVVDYAKKLAYVSSADDSSIYIINLETMTLSKQIKINGMCEKLALSDDGTKLFYFDKKTLDIWAIELNNSYLLKDIGKFPNVSKIDYANDKIYVASRTKNRLAIIDYGTVGLIAEVEIAEKPIDMTHYKNNLFILSAAQNAVQVLDLNTDVITDIISLGTNGFASKIYKIDGTNIALITDSKSGNYSVLDLDTKRIVRTNPIDTTVSSVVVMDRVKKINK